MLENPVTKLGAQLPIAWLDCLLQQINGSLDLHSKLCDIFTQSTEHTAYEGMT